MVDDLNAALSIATLAIAPITSGSGIKVKMLDYCAAGLPILGTPLAFRGLPSHCGVTVDLARMPEAMARLLTNTRMLIRIGNHARSLVERVQWRNIRDELSAVYRAGVSLPVAQGTSLVAECVTEPYFLVDNTTQARYDPKPYTAVTDGAVIKLGKPKTVQCGA